MGVGLHLSPEPHLLQAPTVSGQGEGAGVDMEPVLPDVEDGHLAGLALHTAADINSAKHYQNQAGQKLVI